MSKEVRELRQLDALEQGEAKGDVLGNNVLEEERSLESFGKWHFPHFSSPFLRINTVFGDTI